jgi:hypothetical protein
VGDGKGVTDGVKVGEGTGVSVAKKLKPPPWHEASVNMATMMRANKPANDLFPVCMISSTALYVKTTFRHYTPEGRFAPMPINA